MTHSKKNGISRRAFIYLSGLLAAGLGSNPKSLAQDLSNKSSKVSEWNKLLAEINQFPLLEAIFSRRLAIGHAASEPATGIQLAGALRHFSFYD